MLNEIKKFLKIKIHTKPVEFTIYKKTEHKNYNQLLINYIGNENDIIPAYLLIPKGTGPFPSILIHHQHNGERHFGKSEVMGIVGDENQAFAPELANNGIIVLVPDSICFEDRRKNAKGIIKHDDDFLQHYNEMCYRLLNGKLLMSKIIEDSSIGISLLFHNKLVDKNKIGILGHSYGGNTVLFHLPFDKRIKFGISSGALCSYKQKIEDGTGIEKAEVIPGFIKKYEIKNLLKYSEFKRLLIISGTEDAYSKDAEKIYKEVIDFYKKNDIKNILELKKYEGGHKVSKERFDFIINYIKNI